MGYESIVAVGGVLGLAGGRRASKGNTWKGSQFSISIDIVDHGVLSGKLSFVSFSEVRQE